MNLSRLRHGNTSPKRQRVNQIASIHSLALRACMIVVPLKWIHSLGLKMTGCFGVAISTFKRDNTMKSHIPPKKLILSRGLCLLLVAAWQVIAAGADRDPDWVAPMKQVHSKYQGTRGELAQFGDSITDTRAFWSSLRYKRNNAPPEMVKAFDLVSSYMIEDCWDRKGPENGNKGGKTIRWADQNLPSWLMRLNPEVAIMMFGTNDLNSVPRTEYENKMRDVVRQCLDNGTIVILNTIPPRHGFTDEAAEFSEIIRSIAHDLKVPLIDYHAEILKRRPDDWDGALDKFENYEGYDVPTLIARDGVHPSAPKQYRGDYSAESLTRNGFELRNYLTLLKYGEVIDRVLTAQK